MKAHTLTGLISASYQLHSQRMSLKRSPYPALNYFILNFQKISIDVLLLDMQLSFRSADSCLA